VDDLARQLLMEGLEHMRKTRMWQGTSEFAVLPLPSKQTPVMVLEVSRHSEALTLLHKRAVSIRSTAGKGLFFFTAVSAWGTVSPRGHCVMMVDLVNAPGDVKEVGKMVVDGFRHVLAPRTPTAKDKLIDKEGKKFYPFSLELAKTDRKLDGTKSGGQAWKVKMAVLVEKYGSWVIPFALADRKSPASAWSRGDTLVVQPPHCWTCQSWSHEWSNCEWWRVAGAEVKPAGKPKGWKDLAWEKLRAVEPTPLEPEEEEDEEMAEQTAGPSGPPTKG
jgi:hypothetical protein